MEGKILYFEKGGPQNTEATLKFCLERAKELGIKQVVLASNHGGTALKAWEIFGGAEGKSQSSLEIIAVTICQSYEDVGWTMTSEERKKVEEKGIKVLTGIHALGDDVNTAFGVVSPNQIVTQTLYRFSQGMKVCVEVALMAADAGFLDMDREIIAVAGTDSGADTAIVVKPSYPRKFKEFAIKEILAMPR